MKKLKLQLTGIILLAAIFAIPAQSMAQWKLGLSYQIRDDVPKHGFGIRIERELLSKAPLIDLRLRAYFAYFNENNEITRNSIQFGSVTYYDYGLAGLVGVSLGFFKPYIGAGIGASTLNFENKEAESVFNWSGFIGLELTPIPKINPFIEYRLQPVDEAGELFNNVSEDIFDSTGRWIFGVSISF